MTLIGVIKWSLVAWLAYIEMHMGSMIYLEFTVVYSRI